LGGTVRKLPAIAVLAFELRSGLTVDRGRIPKQNKISIGSNLLLSMLEPMW
jgi:hypothetical protein